MEFASGIAETVSVRLASYAAQEVCLAWGAQHELRKLNKTLLAIKLVLEDAEKKQLQNPLITHWLGNLKDVCNDAEDVLDEFEFRKLRLKVQRSVKGKVHQFFSRWNPVVFNLNMGHKIKEIRERLVEISDEKTQFSLDKVVAVHDDNERVTDSLPEAYVVGRDEEKKQIITYLLNDNNSFNNENVSVISIFGLGGLGKTTLVKMVYNDKVVEENFGMRLWICVSDKFDICTLVKGIIVETKKECDCGNLNLMKRGLQDILRGTKFLLVLDDVWDTESTGFTVQKWDELKTLLDVGAKGSQIIVTTRSESVASLVHPIQMHSLNSLSHENCMILFKKNAFYEGEEQRYQHLIEIGENIVKKCGGVPLALATLGSMLRSKRERRDWLRVKDDEIWSMPGNDNIMAALKLSYNALPPHLKSCFSFCSLYPKDYVFFSKDIVPLWIALGYLKSSKENEDFEETGLDYVRLFCSKSLFQLDLDLKTVITFKIHDLLHDLAISVAGVEYSTVNCRPSSAFEKVRHMSITTNDLPRDEARVPKFILQLEKLRTILNVDGAAGISNQYFLRTCCKMTIYMLTTYAHNHKRD